jgi:hypothetical protein
MAAVSWFESRGAFAFVHDAKFVRIFFDLVQAETERTSMSFTSLTAQHASMAVHVSYNNIDFQEAKLS